MLWHPNWSKKSEQSFDLQELEDFYLPYKKRKKTKADSAREKGLEPLAKIIMSQRNDDIDFLASKYVNNEVTNEDEALQGARDIIAEWVNENLYVRKNLRRLFQRKAIISSKVVKAKKDEEADSEIQPVFRMAGSTQQNPKAIDY